MTDDAWGERSNEVGRSATRMGAVTAVSRLVGMLRVLVIAAVLHTTYLGNAFQSSNSVSNVLFELLAAGALSAVLVPTIVRYLADGRDDDCEKLVGGVLGVALIGLGIVSVLGVVFAPLLARLLTAGTNAAVAPRQRELTTFLLRFFIPQILLYAFGAIATAVLYARRHFAITAAAPIGNTVVMVAFLLIFRASAGADPGFALSTTQRLYLAAAGTGGVVAFVGVLVVACLRSGIRLQPRLARADSAVWELVAHSGWGIMLHSVAGLLLGAALVAGNSVEGGVVAYQAAFVVFLAPYAVLAQPLHTAVLPELSLDAANGDHVQFARHVRFALDRMVTMVAPVTAFLLAASLPAAYVIGFGLDSRGTRLLAGALAGLVIGLVPYSAFLLFARAMYALGNSRTPAMVAALSGIIGVACVAALAPVTHGAARVFAISAAHSVAYTFGAIVLGRLLARRIDGAVFGMHLGVPLAVAAIVGIVAWFAVRGIDVTSRAGALAVATVTAPALLVAYLAGVRLSARRAPLDGGSR